MQHIIALSRTAVIVRHWFEVSLINSAMEHGARIEVRELATVPHRGSESAAQVVAADRPLWRADLFDRHGDPPGTFGVAHFHPHFRGNEPCPRVFDPDLAASPWDWLGAQFTAVGATGGRDPWPLTAADAAELSGLADTIVALARPVGPDRCVSAAHCFALTRDASPIVRLMLESLRRPDLIDPAWVAPWQTAQ